MDNTLTKNDRWFLVILCGACLAAAAVYFEGRMNIQNLTVYLFSYETYGLIPRGLIGTGIAFFCRIFGLTLSYRLCLWISGAATVVWFLVLFLLYAVLLSHTPRAHRTSVKILLVFLSFFTSTEFVTWNNFGRADEYLTILTVIAVILLITERAEWLLIPICAAACLIHTGFAFTNSCLLLALLAYKALNGRKNSMKKYGLIFAGCFLVISVIFLYMEVFRLPVSTDLYHQIEAEAIRLGTEGGQGPDFMPLYSLIDSELLRRDVYDFESIWRGYNVREFPVFLVLFSPYIVWIVLFYAALFRKADSTRRKWQCLMLLGGIVTIVPELLLKVDYGRWMFAILLYEVLVVLSVTAMGDTSAALCVSEVRGRFGKYRLLRMVLLLYPVMFIPFRDVSICDFTLFFVRRLFGYNA